MGWVRHPDLSCMTRPLFARILADPIPIYERKYIMKRFIPLAIVLTVAACQKAQETAPAPSSPPAEQTAPQAAPPPATATEPSQGAPQAPAPAPAPATGQSSGTSGTSDSSGTSGASGTSGTSGSSGTSDSSGASGTSGTSGTSDSSGASGTSGTSGTAGTSGTSADYVVTRGDTLSGIARQRGLNSQDIAQWNNIQDPNRIQEGQTLRMTAP